MGMRSRSALRLLTGVGLCSAIVPSRFENLTRRELQDQNQAFVRDLEACITETAKQVALAYPEWGDNCMPGASPPLDYRSTSPPLPPP